MDEVNVLVFARYANGVEPDSHPDLNILWCGIDSILMFVNINVYRSIRQAILKNYITEITEIQLIKPKMKNICR